MSRSAKLKITTKIFAIIISSAIAVWLLRGFGILTFIPGGLILFLLLSAIAVGILNLWQRRWLRF
ncbi:MAG TPA: hypothetical protein V6D09_16830 [Leptolyngbyaceae cyanobacterium]